MAVLTRRSLVLAALDGVLAKGHGLYLRGRAAALVVKHLACNRRGGRVLFPSLQKRRGVLGHLAPNAYAWMLFGEPPGSKPMGVRTEALPVLGGVAVEVETIATPRAHPIRFSGHETMIRCRRHRFNRQGGLLRVSSRRECAELRLRWHPDALARPHRGDDSQRDRRDRCHYAHDHCVAHVPSSASWTSDNSARA